MNTVKEAISNAVETAVNEALTRTMPSNSGESNCSSKTVRMPTSFMLSFLKKKSKVTGKEKKVWTKDIICIPKAASVKGSKDIPIPKGSKRVELARSGLVEKIYLHSLMDADEVQAEVCSVFKEAMEGKANFPFKFLQAVGGGCKALLA